MKTTFLFLFLSMLSINALGQAVGVSRFGVHIGNLTHALAVPYINALGAPQIYVRGDVPQDEVGWYFVKDASLIPRCTTYCDTSRCPCSCTVGSYYYSNTTLRTPLPAIPQANPFISIKINRYGDTIPTQASDLVGDYPYGHETEYKDYVNFLLQGYKDSAKYWVVGNENEAASFWVGTQQEYADIVALSSGEIRQNCVDCKVGISFAHPNIAKGTPLQKHLWYSTLSAIRDTFDFIDAHYYYPSFIQSLQLDSLKFYFPGKEIISTETGVPDTTMDWGPTMGGIGNTGGTPVKQARDLIKYNTLLFEEGYSKLYWYLIDVDYGMGPIFTHNALLNESGSQKPSFTSYKTMVSKIDSFTTITKLSTGQYNYDFANKGPIYILWCDSGSCTLPSQITGTVTVTDYMGSVQTMQSFQVVLDSFPIFVELGAINSINDSHKSQNNFSIYPNPFSSLTTLQTDNLLKNATLTVYNSFGQTVAQIKNISGQTVTFSRDNLASGLYFIRLTEETKIIAADKLVIAD